MVACAASLVRGDASSVACTLIGAVPVLGAAHAVRLELVERVAVDVAQVIIPLLVGAQLPDLLVDINEQRVVLL